MKDLTLKTERMYSHELRIRFLPRVGKNFFYSYPSNYRTIDSVMVGGFHLF